MQKFEKSFRRGEIYFCDFGNGEGSVQGGKRPVLILQEEGFNHKAPTIIVEAIITVIRKTYLNSKNLSATRTGNILFIYIDIM